MKKILFAVFMVITMVFVVSCSEDELSDAIGGSCDVEGAESCSDDASQIIVCSNYTWQTKKVCNQNFGEYCRLTSSGSYSCKGSSNNDSTDTESGDNTDSELPDSTPEDTDTDTNTDTDTATDTDTNTDTDTATDTDTDTDSDSDTSTDTDSNTDTDTGDTDVCTDCDGSGLKITGTVTLFHPSAVPNPSTYTGLGGVQDASEYFPPCETSVTLGDKSVYGTLTVNLNTKHIASAAEMDALTQITGTETFIQVKHSVSGTMGSAAFPKNQSGITMSYYSTSTDSETGTTETNLFIDDMDLINGNLSDIAAVRIFCSADQVTSGVKKIGPFNNDDCVFFVLDFGTETKDACWYALGVSDPDIVNDGLTFTVQ